MKIDIIYRREIKSIASLASKLIHDVKFQTKILKSIKEDDLLVFVLYKRYGNQNLYHPMNIVSQPNLSIFFFQFIT